LPRPGTIARILERSPRTIDTLVAVTALVIALLVETAPYHQIDGVLFIPAFIACAALPFRRAYPVVTLGVVLAATCALVVVERYPSWICLAIAVYSIAVFRSTRSAVAAAALSFGAVVAAETVSADDSANAMELTAFTVAATITVALLLGIIRGSRIRYVAAVVDRSDHREQLAVIGERNRIAREMHDVVAHGLSVMVRLSDGADAVADADPERSREAVRQIGVTGRACLADMRRLLGVLDDGVEAGRAPQPTLSELEPLLETYRVTGMPVRLRERGIRPTDPAVQVVVYRAVQESLTNALRYAVGARHVVVSLRFDVEEIEVDVTDDGDSDAPVPPVGTGHGLLGLRERAALYGGQVEAGPLQGSGWRTRMTLPRPEDDRS
jgi:signal transduction histidine kinase